LSGMTIVLSEKLLKIRFDCDDAHCTCERAQVHAYYIDRSGLGKGITFFRDPFHLRHIPC